MSAIGDLHSVNGQVPEPSVFDRIRHTGRERSQSAAWALAVGLTFAVPAVLIGTILLLVTNHSSRVPISDEWEMVDLVRKLHEGTLSLGDFWSFHVHNEHRIVASRAISLAVIELTDWNRVAHTVVALVIVGLTVALMLRAAKWTLASRKTTLLVAAPVLVLSFSLTRYENWALPFTDKIPTALGVGICVWALAAPSAGPGRLVLAMLGALLASLSSLGGLLTWFAFAPAIFCLGWRYLLIWGVAALAVIVPYTIGFPTGTLNSSFDRQAFTLPGPTEAVAFMFAYLGAPLGFPDFARSQAFGAIGLCVMVFNLIALTKGKDLSFRAARILLVWLGLAAFAFGSGIAVLIGRETGFGLEAALWSRFHAFTSLWWVSLIVLSALSLKHVRFRSTEIDRPLLWPERLVVALNGIVAIAFLLGLMSANLSGSRSMDSYLRPYGDLEYCVFNATRASDKCLRTFHWDVAKVRERTAYLAQHNLAFFGPENRIPNVDGVPPADAANTGRFRCAFATVDPRASLPSSVSPEVVSEICRRIDNASWGGVSPPAEIGDVGTLCSVGGWSILGEWRVISGEAWCGADWFNGETLVATSLMRSDGSFSIHGYEDGTLDMFVEGARLKRPK